jgi:hypothetical protein
VRTRRRGSRSRTTSYCRTPTLTRRAVLPCALFFRVLCSQASFRVLCSHTSFRVLCSHGPSVCFVHMRPSVCFVRMAVGLVRWQLSRSLHYVSDGGALQNYCDYWPSCMSSTAGCVPMEQTLEALREYHADLRLNVSLYHLDPFWWSQARATASFKQHSRPSRVPTPRCTAYTSTPRPRLRTARILYMSS